MARVLLVCLALVGSSYSNPDGLPKASCDDLDPGHGSEYMFTRTNGDKRYDILPEGYVFLPGESMKIQVWDREGISKPLQGACIQVRRTATNEIAGVWSLATGITTMKTVDCTNRRDSLTHKDDSKKTDDQIAAVWTAPMICKKNEQFHIFAAIAQTQFMWHHHSVPLVCDPDYSDEAVMERVRPPVKSKYCGKRSWAIIPARASESFDEGLAGVGRWRHYFGASQFRFLMKSKETGPLSPQDGSRYFYYGETASDTMAGLLSPFGIQGCFCFSFYYYMKTEGETELVVVTFGKQTEEILREKGTTTEWKRFLYDGISEQTVEFTIQAFSYGGGGGGVGIDNIQVTPGPCSAS